jgi:hypothetical protein
MLRKVATTNNHGHIARAAVLFFALQSVTQAGPNKVKTANSAGNDQTTFVMTLNATTCPFCNVTETVGDPGDSNRSTAAAYLPALIAPGFCGQESAKWELSQDPFTSKTFLQSGTFQSADLAKVISGLYIEKYGTFATTLSAGVKAGENTATLTASSDVISKSLRTGTLVVVDNVNPELAVVTKIDKQTVYIQSTGKNSGWKSDHVAQAPVQAVDQASDCEAGKAEILLDRAFRYGFCNPNIYNLGTEDLKVSVLDSHFDKNEADFYIVNVVVWKKTDTTYSSSSSNWYVYNRGDHGHWYRQKLPYFNGSLRIYGSKKPIGLVAIHVRANDDTPWKDFQQLGISYTVSVKSKTPANVSDLQTALSIIWGGTSPQAQAVRPDPDGFYGTLLFKAKAAADITITAQVDFSKLTPAKPKDTPATQQPPTDHNGPTAQDHNAPNRSGPLENSVAYETSVMSEREEADSVMVPPQAVSSEFPVQPHSDGWRVQRINFIREAPLSFNSRASIFEEQGNGGSQKPGNKQNSQAGNQKNQTGNSSQNNQKNTTQTSQNPSADCPPSSNGKQSPCTFTATVNDEDLYHWDVSFAVPFHTISELQYNQPTGNGSSVVPKNVTRLNAYALFDVYPIAADIVTPPIVSVPHVFVGLPISGKVFNKPMFGAAEGFNFKKIFSFIPIQASFFGGVVYNKVFDQIPGTTGSANVVGHRVWKGTYGIEIPVTQFKGLLSTKKSNTSPSTSNKNTPTDTTN